MFEQPECRADADIDIASGATSGESLGTLDVAHMSLRQSRRTPLACDNSAAAFG